MQIFLVWFVCSNRPYATRSQVAKPECRRRKTKSTTTATKRQKTRRKRTKMKNKQLKSYDKLRVEHKFTHQQKQHVLAGDHMSVRRARSRSTQTTTYIDIRQPCECTEKDVHIAVSQQQQAAASIWVLAKCVCTILPSSSRHLCAMCIIMCARESWVQFLGFCSHRCRRRRRRRWSRIFFCAKNNNNNDSSLRCRRNATNFVVIFFSRPLRNYASRC